jgi:hypothetical protein
MKPMEQPHHSIIVTISPAQYLRSTVTSVENLLLLKREKKVVSECFKAEAFGKTVGQGTTLVKVD